MPASCGSPTSGVVTSTLTVAYLEVFTEEELQLVHTKYLDFNRSGNGIDPNIPPVQPPPPPDKPYHPYSHTPPSSPKAPTNPPSSALPPTQAAIDTPSISHAPMVPLSNQQSTSTQTTHPSTKAPKDDAEQEVQKPPVFQYDS